MEYQDAKNIRKKSFGTLLGEQEGGFGASLKKTLSLKSQARTAGIKETFDPMNIAKFIGGKTGAAIYGKMFNRSKEDMSYFAGSKFKKGMESPLENINSDDPSSPVQILGMIYDELVKCEEYKISKFEKEQSLKEEEVAEEERRYYLLLEAIRGLRAAPKVKTKKRKEEEKDKKKEEEKKKKEEPTKPAETPVEVPKPTETKVPETKVPTTKVPETKAPVTKPKTSTPAAKPAVPSTPASTAAKVATGVAVGTVGSNAIADIVEVGPGYNIVKRPDGSVEKQVGDRNWRNNNPGNIRYDGVKYKNAANWGAIGTDGEFAIFPSYEVGRQAKANLIFENQSYKNLSLTDAIYKYAPPQDKNDTKSYQEEVLMAVGNQNKTMKEFNENERIKILDAIQKREGLRKGKTIAISKPTSAENLSAKSSDSGSQIDQMSKENKNLKQSSNSKGNPNVTNINTTVAQNSTKVNVPTDQTNDQNPYLAKSKS
jgi:hypothetical protein